MKLAKVTFTAEEIVKLLGAQALTQLTTGGCTTQELTAADQLAQRLEPNPLEWHRNGAISPLLRWAQSDRRTWASFRRWIATALGDDPNEVSENKEEGTENGAFSVPGRRLRKPITDPDQLERRKQALAKARAARALRLAEARGAGGDRASKDQGADQPDVVDMALGGVVGPR
jgi:hypothetical protein